MCSINHELKLIFIHTPKCGGLFIEKILDKYYGFKTYYFTHENHELFIDDIDKDNSIKGFLKITKQGVLRYFMSSSIHNEKIEMTYDKWCSYKKFAIKRNIYDRFISACKYIHKTPIEDNNDLINYMNLTNKKNYDYFHLYITQYDHLLDVNNEFKIDHMINFENLNKELCYFLLQNGVSEIKHRYILLNDRKLNSSPTNENYTKYYNQELINFVNKIFSIDFEKFEYTKVSTIEELIIDSKKYFISNEEFSFNNKQLINELDNNNQIIQFNDISYLKMIKARESNLEKNEENNEESNNVLQTENEIILPNGVILNTRQEKRKVKQKIDKNVHLNNIITLFKTLSTDKNEMN